MGRIIGGITTLMHALVLMFGLAIYSMTRKTPKYSYFSFRQLFCLTNGRINDAAGSVSAVLHRPYYISSSEGVLGKVDESALVRIVDEIRTNGFYIFDKKLDIATCRELAEFALTVPARLTPRPNNNGHPAVYDRRQLRATRYDLPEQSIFQSHTAQALALDLSIFMVAQSYLECRPVHDLTSMWWTVAYGDKPSAQAAQLFHFDMDRFRFIKFFIYLTDVGVENGPHVYVSGSHVRKPAFLSRDGRIEDSEITSNYPSNKIIEIYGEAGTIFAADTRGFHKGKAPIAGERLVFQVEYSNSLFGAPFDTVNVTDDWSSKALWNITHFPYTFQRFKS